MEQYFEETCIIYALADLDALTSSNEMWAKNEHAQEAERNLRLLLAELPDLRAQDGGHEINSAFALEKEG